MKQNIYTFVVIVVCVCDTSPFLNSVSVIVIKLKFIFLYANILLFTNQLSKYFEGYMVRENNSATNGGRNCLASPTILNGEMWSTTINRCRPTVFAIIILEPSKYFDS